MEKKKDSKHKTHCKVQVQKSMRKHFRSKSAKAEDDSFMKSSYQLDFSDYTGSMLPERHDDVTHDPTLRHSNPRTDPPGEPSKPRVSEVAARSCVLEWTEPQDDGGSPIERYHIQSRTRGSSGWAAMRGGTTTSTRHKLTRLTPGTVYQFRVAAENAAKVGVGGPESDYVQAAEPPDMPSKPNVTESSRTHCTLSWKSPQFSGGSGITGYHVEYRTTWPETRHWSRVTNGVVLGKQYTVRDVLPVTSYYFRIVAVNKIGEGNPGIESELVETIDNPGYVEAPAVSDITATSCVISWRPPDDDGGATILGYHVEQCRTGSFGWMRLTDTLANGTTFTTSGLIKSYKYRFRIIAVNKKGEGGVGHESVEVEAIEPPGPPAHPPAVSDVTFQSCLVSWEPPVDHGGSPIIGYCIERKQVSDKSWTPVVCTTTQQYSIRASWLAENCLYCFRVRAINKAGEGMPSDISDGIKTTGQDISDAYSIASIRTDQLEEWGMARVKEAFGRGLNNINQLIEIILSLRNSISFREFEHIGSSLKHYSADAYFNITDALDKAEKLKVELSNRIEALENEKEIKKSEMAQTKKRIAKLNAEMAEKQAQSKILKEELFKVSLEYNNAEERLSAAKKKLEDKKFEQKAVGAVGLGLAVIPVGGQIATMTGAVMFVGSLTVLEKNVEAAKDKCDTVRLNKNEQKDRVACKRKEINNCDSEIKHNESEMVTLNSQISDLKSNITDLQAQFKHQCDFIHNLRDCVTFISITAGRTEVLHDQVKFLYNPAAIVDPLVELAAHLSLPEMDALRLQTDDLQGVESFVSKLKMIVDADDCWKHDNMLDFEKGRLLPSILTF